MLLVAIGTTFVVYLLYEVVAVAAFGRTLGKRWMGIVVVGNDGLRPGLWRSIRRIFLPTVALVVFFPLYPFVYAASIITKDHRWPNDGLAGTRVVLALS